MGPVLFGSRGVDIEFMKEVALAGAPIDEREARRLIARTKAWIKLEGFRGKGGRPPLHPSSVVKARVRLSNLIADANGGIASIDVNPFLVSTRKRIAVDAVVLKNASSEGAGRPKSSSDAAPQAHLASGACLRTYR
ncbi:hypothetical protein ABIB08_008888 [Bradyrhizobium sp. RT11b]